MLRIDKLNLSLPAGYAHRAAGIARQVGEHLARRDIHGLRGTEADRDASFCAHCGRKRD